MKNDPAPCLVLTTWPADRPLAPLARGVVDARLAACVHVMASGRSTYRWDGTIEEAEERQVVFKTTRACLEALEAHVRAQHPYALPEWLVVDVTGSPDYLAWLAAGVGPPPAGVGPPAAGR
ncbi:MAG: divalent-cation tolerance protein CutA [Vicinamibacterales bacterium]